jgi:hypothetical protein
MNTNQSKRKKEFSRKVDCTKFDAHLKLREVIRHSDFNAFYSELTGRISHIYCRTNYTDNTQFFGEDYQTEKQL